MSTRIGMVGAEPKQAEKPATAPAEADGKQERAKKPAKTEKQS